MNINESVVRGFANEIRQYGFLDSQLEIDDEWESCYGEATFNKDKFPDVPGMISDLNNQVRLLTQPHTFVKQDGNHFRASGRPSGFTPS